MKLSRIMPVLLLVAAIVLAAGCDRKPVKTKKFSFTPARPAAMDKITINYRFDDNPPASGSIIFRAFYMTADMPRLEEVELRKSGDLWTGTLPASGPDVFGILGVFKGADGWSDNNGGKGYAMAFYSGAGEPVPGYGAALASATAVWGQSLAGIDEDMKLGLTMIEHDFQETPALKSTFLSNYISILMGMKPEGWQDKVLAFLDEMAPAGNLNDAAYMTMFSTYTRLGKIDKAEAVKDKAVAAFPRGELAQMLAYRRISGEQDIAKLKASYGTFQKEFPGSSWSEAFFSIILKNYLKNGKFDDAFALVEAEGEAVKPSYYDAVVQQAMHDGASNELVMKCIDRGMDALERQLRDADKLKPSYRSVSDWRKSILQDTGSSLSDLKGRVLIKSGQTEQAVACFKSAYEATEGIEINYTGDYARALAGTGKYEEAMNVLGKAVKEGRSDKEMVEMLRTAYARVKGTSDGCDAYLAGLENEAVTALRTRLAKEIIERPAPDFELKDLSGATIKTADLRGRVLVIDFWATWCGPCRASFPAMAALVDNFKNDDSVRFLFINTWQNEENKAEVVARFLKQNKYGFTALLDEKNEVVGRFKVTGIPTKFVVDGKGNIRFVVVGYDGNEVGTIKEVTQMINMVKSGKAGA